MRHTLSKALLLAALALAPAARAEINVPSDGSDGVFAPLTNIVIDLSQATNGVWDQNNAANAGRGVYDPEKWAVVFKFQSVTIPANVTVRFLNHPSRAPVVWLVQSNVLINGVVSVNGQAGDNNAALANVNIEGGPGGFRGGLGTASNGQGLNNSLGPVPGFYSQSYGNSQIVPLIGGPGMWSYPTVNFNRHASGGGAILIASRSLITVGGSVTADGGYGWTGGAVRLVCDVVAGSGTFSGSRIRIEANSQQLTNPSWVEYLASKPGNPPLIWPGADAPKARIVSIGAVTNGTYANISAPAEPLAPLNGNPDLLIQTTNSVDIFVETRNFPVEGYVTVRVIPKYADSWNVGASRVSGNYSNALWKATTTLGSTYTTLQVRASVP